MRNLFIPALLVASLVSMASAQERPRNPARGWYVGAEAGLAKLDGDIRYEGDDVSFEDESHLVTLHAGYRFNRILSLGAYLTDFGGFSAAREGYAADASLNLFGVQFVGRVPIGEKFDVHGIVMAVFNSMRFTARVPDGTVFKDDGGGLNARFGLGLGYRLNPRVDLRLDLLHTDSVNRGFMSFGGFPLGFNGDLTSVTLGLHYKL